MKQKYIETYQDKNGCYVYKKSNMTLKIFLCCIVGIVSILIYSQDYKPKSKYLRNVKYSEDGENLILTVQELRALCEEAYSDGWDDATDHLENQYKKRNRQRTNDTVKGYNHLFNKNNNSSRTNNNYNNNNNNNNNVEVIDYYKSKINW
jgi:hypothetical protein